MVHGRGFCGTERDGGHGWYTGGASEVRNGMEDTVGTQEGLLRYGKGWRTRLVHGRGFCGTERDGGTRLVHGKGFRGTERDQGHSWYTEGASEARNGAKEAVGTPQCILVYEMCGMKDLYTR